MKKIHYRLAGLLVAGLAAASAAQADDLIVNQSYQGWSATVVDANGPQVAALFDVKNLSAGGSFLAYCIEPAQAALSTSASYTASAYAASANVQELYDRFYADVTTSKTNAVAFQLALWDLAGKAPINGYSYVGDTAAKAQAISWIGAVTADATAVAQKYQLTQWSNAAQQDVLQAAPVPEPATYALLLGGLGAVAMVARRRGRQAD